MKLRFYVHAGAKFGTHSNYLHLHIARLLGHPGRRLIVQMVRAGRRAGFVMRCDSEAVKQCRTEALYAEAALGGGTDVRIGG